MKPAGPSRRSLPGRPRETRLKGAAGWAVILARDEVLAVQCARRLGLPVCEDSIRSMFTARSDLAACLLARVADDRHAPKTIGVVTTAATPGILRQIWQEGMQEPKTR